MRTDIRGHVSQIDFNAPPIRMSAASGHRSFSHSHKCNYCRLTPACHPSVITIIGLHPALSCDASSIFIKLYLKTASIFAFSISLFHVGAQPRLKNWGNQGVGPYTGALAPRTRAGCWMREGIAPSRCDGPGISPPENFGKLRC